MMLARVGARRRSHRDEAGDRGGCAGEVGPSCRRRVFVTPLRDRWEAVVCWIEIKRWIIV
jgi:hypothetical protein